MMRGTYGNVRIRNRMAGDRDGWWTRIYPEGDPITIPNAAMRYRERGTPLIVLGGYNFGAGSSRDWAAKGPALLGVRAVIARSYERIHRSNLIGVGIVLRGRLRRSKASTFSILTAARTFLSTACRKE